MLNDIINYGVRVVIILLGILLATGVLTTGENDPMLRIIGIIAILFGLYRIIMYNRNKAKYKTFNKEKKGAQIDNNNKFYYDDFDDNNVVDNTDSNNSNDDN